MFFFVFGKILIGTHFTNYMAKKVNGYFMGNDSDLVKHSNLEALAKNLGFGVYVEFHSGAGKGEDIDGKVYEGSSLRILREMHKRGGYEVFLHENKGEVRKLLEGNVGKFRKSNGNIFVRGRWQDSVEDYCNSANEDWLFLIDPTKMTDYSQKNGILDYFDKILDTNAHIFMYAPENLCLEIQTRNKQSDIIKRVKKMTRDSKRAGIDLCLPVQGSGIHKRRDHNIVISDCSVLSKVGKNHKIICNATFSKSGKTDRF